MGIIYSGICKKCGKLHNYDLGIGFFYSPEQLLSKEEENNILLLFKEKSRKDELKELINNGGCILEDGYGNKLCKCPKCKKTFPRFIFKLIKPDGTEFKPSYKCHDCRWYELEPIEEELIDKENILCSNCGEEIELFQSGCWD